PFILPARVPDRLRKLLVCAFLECSAVSFVDSSAPKPFETFVTKQPGGRVYERHNWSWFPFFSEIAALFRPHNQKWLVVRSNCVAYFGDLDETTPHEVLMLDRFFDFKVCAREKNGCRGRLSAPNEDPPSDRAHNRRPERLPRADDARRVQAAHQAHRRRAD